MKNNSRLTTITVALITTLLSTSALGAEEFARGAGALEGFDGEAFVAAPLGVKLWLAFVFSTLTAGLLFAWKKAIAWWAAGGLFVGVGFRSSRPLLTLS